MSFEQQVRETAYHLTSTLTPDQAYNASLLVDATSVEESNVPDVIEVSDSLKRLLALNAMSRGFIPSIPGHVEMALMMAMQQKAPEMFLASLELMRQRQTKGEAAL